MEQLYTAPASCCSQDGDQRDEDKGWGELCRWRTALPGGLGYGAGGPELGLGLF